jgi:hypothetical protein
MENRGGGSAKGEGEVGDANGGIQEFRDWRIPKSLNP